MLLVQQAALPIPDGFRSGGRCCGRYSVPCIPSPTDLFAYADGTIYSVYNTSLTALKAEQQFWQFARLNRNYLVHAKNAVEFDRKRNVIWMQDGQKIKGKKDAIIDMLMLVAAECWHDYGEINEEDVEALQK